MPIHLITGPMFAGKTTVLLEILKAKKPNSVVLLKHRDDTRFPVRDKVLTHTGASFPCTIVQNLEDINRNCYEDWCTIAVDEGQFFPNIYEMASKWACQGKEVIITAISNGLFMEPLRQIANLMAVSDKITKLTAVCTSCIADANFSYRKTPFPEHVSPTSPTFFLGGEESYKALCRRCFVKHIQHDHSQQTGMFSGEGVQKLDLLPTDILTWDVGLSGNT